MTPDGGRAHEVLPPRRVRPIIPAMSQNIIDFSAPSKKPRLRPTACWPALPGSVTPIPAGFEGSWEVVEDCTKFYAIFEART